MNGLDVSTVDYVGANQNKATNQNEGGLIRIEDIQSEFRKSNQNSSEFRKPIGPIRN